MMRTTRAGIWATAMLVVMSILSGLTQDGTDRAESTDRSAALTALSPENPSGYQELGEWVLLNASDREETDLAVELLVRAVYWGAEAGNARVASTSCIALGELVDNEPTRRWLWDLALLLDPSREAEWLSKMETNDEQRVTLTLDATRCLYAIRYHQQPLGGELYAQQEVRERIYEAGAMAGIDWSQLDQVLKREIVSGETDACKGRLYVVDRDQRDQRRACPDHLRGVGMGANDADLTIMLKTEMALMGVSGDSWETSVSMGGGLLRVPRIEDLGVIFKVNAARAFYRDGRWVATK